MVGDHRQKFGKYAVLGLLGQGGMARVYLALSSGPSGVNKLLVIKELKSELAAEPSARTMFLDEARIATRLNHPNVVQTHEVSDERGVMYLTMEYLEGQSLQNVLAAGGAKLPLPLVLRVISDTLAGLQHAHELRDYDGTPLHVVHRDVSPHNVFVTYDGTVKLVDFGIAKAKDAATSTESGLFKGKVRYSAPEQAAGEMIDRRADIFSMGVVLWEALAGRRMWNKEADASILLRLVQSDLPRLREANPDVAPELEAICTRALAGSPAARFATAEEMRQELLRYVEAQNFRGTPDLGEWMRETFATERAATRTMIEEQMRLLKDGAKSGARAVIPSLLAPKYTSSAMTDLASERSAQMGATSRSDSTRLLLGAISGVLVIAAIAFTALRSSSVGLAPTAAASVEGQRGLPFAETDAARERPGSGPVRVRIRVQPQDSELYLDGAKLTLNPYEAEYPRDAMNHELVARAEGHADQSFSLRFDRDIDMVVALAPRPKSAPTPSSHAAPASSSKAPRGNGSVRPGSRRNIDEDDPYHR